MAPPTRGKEKLVNVGLRLTVDEVQEVDALAEDREIPRGEMVRRMVRQVLKAHQREVQNLRRKP